MVRDSGHPKSSSSPGLSSTDADLEGAYAAGARAASRTSRNGDGSFSRPPSHPACGKTHSLHSQRLTELSASEKLTAAFPGQRIAPVRFASGRAWYNTVITVYRPNRQGAARSTVWRHHPRVVSNPRQERISWKVVSMFQRLV